MDFINNLKIKKNEKDANTIISLIKLNSIFGLDEYTNMMNDWYIRLNERNKDNTDALLKNSKDWLNYCNLKITAIEINSQWIDSDDAKETENLDKRLKECLLRLEEIENRFSLMLGREYVTLLHSLRQDKKEEAKNFSISDLIN